MSEVFYKILDIIKGTTVDGPGLRTSIYFAGCEHKCLGCHNPQSWDPNGGRSYSLSELMKIIEEEDFNVTLSGGDPLLYPSSLKFLINKIKGFGKNIWLYTGYTWEEILNSEEMKKTVSNVDVIVDGPFDQKLYNPDLRFKGSSNQRLIKVKESLSSGKIVLYE